MKLTRLLLLVLLPTAAWSQDLPPELVRYADFVFYNGNVLTADADRDFTVAEAVAVRDETILAVGTSERILRFAGPDTRRIDLAGRSLTPGFIYSDGDNAVPAGDIIKDSQWGGFTHPHLGGESLDQALATLSFIVDQESASGVPLFFNLSDSWASIAMRSWGISTLDEVAPEIPIAVYLDSSYGLVNTAMIELALSKGFPVDHSTSTAMPTVTSRAKQVRSSSASSAGRSGRGLIPDGLTRLQSPVPRKRWRSTLATASRLRQVT